MRVESWNQQQPTKRICFTSTNLCFCVKATARHVFIRRAPSFTFKIPKRRDCLRQYPAPASCDADDSRLQPDFLLHVDHLDQRGWRRWGLNDAHHERLDCHFFLDVHYLHARWRRRCHLNGNGHHGHSHWGRHEARHDSYFGSPWRWGRWYLVRLLQNRDAGLRTKRLGGWRLGWRCRDGTLRPGGRAGAGIPRTVYYDYLGLRCRLGRFGNPSRRS